MFSHWIGRMEVYRGGTNMIKEFQIGIEGPKDELLDFIHDFEFNKMTLNVMNDKAVFTIVTELDENTREILEVIQKNQMN